MKNKLLHAVITVLIMTVFFASCSSNSGTQSVNTGYFETPGYGLDYESAEVWGTTATTRVLQNVHGIYDNDRNGAEIKLTTARGEYESSHIIMTAKQDFSYEVKTSDLKASDGTIFPAENVEIFHELYIEVKVNVEGNGAPIGMYPDCLVPFENLKDLGENVVKKGNNQGLYVRFNVAIDQKPSVYTGSFELKIGNESKNIPIQITVVDVEVSEVNHSKSIYLVGWGAYAGDLDATQDMRFAYVDKMLEYRINPDCFLVSRDNSTEEKEYYAELMYEYTKNPKFSTIHIPTVASFNGMSIDRNDLDEYLTIFFNKSIEKNFNLLEMSYLYCVDEPDDQGIYEIAKATCLDVNAQLKETADRLAADETITSPMKDELIESIRNMLNVVTNPRTGHYEGLINCYCPIYSFFDTESGRAVYDEMDERWWYNALYPRAPYPTYHLDSTLFGERLINWMRVDYNIEGELYWAVDFYSTDYINFPEDFYGGDARREGASNGEGYLFYPGQKYGVDGPLASLRLEALRDGLEEFEILHSIKANYEAVDAVISEETEYDCSFDGFISSLTEYLYNGMKLSATEETFAAARTELLKIAEINNSPVQMCMLGSNNDGYGTETFGFLTKKGSIVKDKGELISPISVNSDYDYYKVVVKCDQEKNESNISIEKDGKTYTYDRNFGGKATIYDADKFATTDFSKDATQNNSTAVNATPINAGTIASEYEGKTFMKLDVAGAIRDGLQTFRISNEAISGLDNKSKKMFLHLYFDGESDLGTSIVAKFKNQSIYVGLSNDTIKKGMNTIEITPSATWENLGDIEYLVVRIETDKKINKTLYFSDAVVYKR